MIGWLLGLWTAVGALWWGIAILLVWHRRSASADAESAAKAAPRDERLLSIFKPLPGGLGQAEFEAIMGCVASFAAALDEQSELLIGYEPPDGPRLRAALAQMRPAAGTIRAVPHSAGERYANPKVSRLYDLAGHARGALWLWSDADIIAPPELLAVLRRDFARGVGMVLCPYVIDEARSLGEHLDKFYVNAEFYPGVRLLARLGQLWIGFGAGMLFEAERFRSRVEWDYLGSCLADDYHLGRLLGPGELSSVCVRSLPSARDWSGAWSHYRRWHKTIRWNEPLPYGFQLAVMPVLGWLALSLLDPADPLPWLGLAAVVTLESAAAVTLCRVLRCPVELAELYAAPVWSIARGLAWMAAWLPMPVFWCGRKWSAPFQAAPQAGD